MRILLSGGGTGGHIYPSLAIVREFERQFRLVEVMYVGSSRGLEADIVPKAGIPFQSIDIQGFRRKVSLHNVRTIQLFVRAVRRSKTIIRSFRPDVVVGTGGYVSGPVVYAARRLGIPTLIHEQNVVPGLTNKFLARLADCVAVSFEGSEHFFGKAKRLVVSGNPRASEVAAADRSKGRTSLNLSGDSLPIVLVFGGSRGARPINDAVLSIVPDIVKQSSFHVVYVTGEVHYESVRERIGRVTGGRDALIVRPYIYNMPEVLAASSLVISRAGASTLAELTALGIPSILIPSPYVTNNHQEKNARWMEKQGASVVISEKDLRGEALWRTMTRIMHDPVKREQMGNAALRLGRPAAAAHIVAELDKLVKGN